MGAERYLTPERAAAVYDRVGRLQNTQSFYEDPAVEALIQAARFEDASAVVEVGCGTGALAVRLLAEHLTRDAHYVGLDLSPRMVALTTERLRGWPRQAQVVQVDGRSPWPVPDSSADRIVAVYVLDLLSPAAIDAFFAEAARVLRPGGLVAVAGLVPATTGVARLVSGAWLRVWRLNPLLTGGCRPVDVAARLPAGWTVHTRRQLTSFGVTSGLLVAEPPGD